MSIPTLAELITIVVGAIQDSSETGDPVVTRHFNRALYRLANHVVIPDLVKVDTVDTVVGENITPLPSDFHRNLKICFNLTKRNHILVYNSRSLIDRRVSRFNDIGDVIAVTQEAKNLYYQRQPSTAQTLQITYSSKPVTIVSNETLPSYLPEDILTSLLTEFAIWQIHAKMENGIENESKINTKYRKGEFLEAFAMAKGYFGPEEDEPYAVLESNSFPNNMNFNGCM